MATKKEMGALVAAYLEAKAAKTAAEEAFSAAEAALKEALGDTESAEIYTRKLWFTITYKARKGAIRIDGAALKAAEPEIYARFAVTGKPSRPLFVKPK